MTIQNILFTSVLGPYGVDSARSRFKNPMSLLSNQVMRGQMYYTVQMCSRTFAFDMFGANLAANVAIVDFPRPRHLRAALRSLSWDRVGISSIAPNIEALLDTYSLVRSVLPAVPIDIGGHAANDEEVVREIVGRMSERVPGDRFRLWIPDWERERLKTRPSHLQTWLEERGIAGDRVTFVKRDGIEYYARLPGVGLKRPGAIHAPLVDASFGKRVLGIPVPSTSAGLIIPDVGCPMRCNFCSTSHKFNGRFVQFLKSAEDIMAVANAHADRGRDEMFVMSENFSLDTRRALRLLELMERQRRPHRYSVFSSANGLVKLGIENIVKLGYTFVWIGLEESTGTTFNKVQGIDLRKLVSELQEHGVEVLGSTILGFEHHTAGQIDREIEHALGFGCVYNQFMLYMPVPGTALWDEMKTAGRLKPGFPWPDSHGQALQNWNHPRLGEKELEKKLDRAFELDFEKLGPSLYRMMRVHFDGYVKTRNWNHELVQLRRAMMRKMFVKYIPFLTAMHWDLRGIGHGVARKVRDLRDAMIEETGWSGRLARLAAGPLVHASLQLEKIRFHLSQRLRRAESPRCQLTHWGEFTHRYPLWMPRLAGAPGVVGIERPFAESEPRPRSAPPTGQNVAFPKDGRFDSCVNP